MAICPKCNTKLSDNVVALHIKRCNVVEEVEKHDDIKDNIEELENNLEETEEEIRAKAKELGITSWHIKSIERLKEEIGEVM